MKPKHNQSKQEIEVLLKRFENGETSRVEEERLQKWLQLEENKNNYPEEAALFTYFENAKKEIETTSFAKHVFEEQPIQQQDSKTNSTRFSTFFKYVAILIIALGTVFFTIQYQQDKIKKEEARMAYLETKKALHIISEEMNKATDKLSEIENFTQQTQKFINP